MRPISKLNVGDSVTTDDGMSHTIKDKYIPYSTAKPILVANFGRFCSYCEDAFHQNRDLEVEHIHPKCKQKYKNQENDWENFLLSCSTCNGNGNKGKKDVSFDNCHFPHVNNTFLSLKYMDGGVVVVNPDLSGISKQKAQTLIELVGLDKSPKTSTMGDARWHKRSTDWKLAQRYLVKYDNGNVDVDTIIDLVRSRGGWSIWFTVFRGRDDVLFHLISDIQGTCKECFDSNNHFAPVGRNPGQPDFV